MSIRNLQCPSGMPIHRYRPFAPVSLPDRQWPSRAIGEEMRREAAARGVCAHVAVAGTRMAALLLAIARPGLTVVAQADEAAALAPLAIGILEKTDDDRTQS